MTQTTLMTAYKIEFCGKRSSLLSLPLHCLTLQSMELSLAAQDANVFCNTSEQSYGTDAYMCTEDVQHQMNVSILMAKSCVAPQNSYPFHGLSYVQPSLGLNASVSSKQSSSFIFNKPCYGLTPPLFSNGYSLTHALTNYLLEQG